MAAAILAMSLFVVLVAWEIIDSFYRGHTNDCACTECRVHREDC